jgi:hypothetical protein
MEGLAATVCMGEMKWDYLMEKEVNARAKIILGKLL